MALTKVPSNLDAAVSITQSQSDNSTNVATTAYVDTAISNLSDSAPAALNTLNEIAAALGDDANYAATTTAAIADKLPLSGGIMTGNLTVQTLVGINKAVNSSVGLSVGSDAASATSYGLEVTNNSSNTRFLVDGLGSQRFYGSDNAETARFTDGKLGIGNPAPKARVHIGTLTGGDGTAQEQLRLSGDFTATNSGALLRFTNQHNSGTNPNAGEYNLAGIKAFDFRSDWGGGIALQTAPNTAYGGTLTDRLVINPEGLVGIGTSIPTAPLHVFKGESGGVSNNTDSSLVLENSSHTYINFLTPASKEAGILWGDDASANTGMITYSHVTDNMTITAADDIILNADKINIGNNKPLWSGSYGGALFLKGNNATSDRYAQLCIVDSTGAIAQEGLVVRGGNVGIGTTNPQAKLHVKGTNSYGSLRISPTSANGEAAMAFFPDVAGTGTGTAWVVGQAPWGHTGDFAIGNQAFGGPIMLIQQNGRVGIGTTSPDYHLDVESTSHSTIRIHAGANSSASLRLKNDAQDWDVNTQTNDNFAVYNQTSATQPFTIRPAGQVQTPLNPAFRARAKTGQVYASGWQKVLYDEAVTTRGTGYASSRFTAPVDGWYQFNAQWTANDNADNDGTFSFWINGSASDLAASVSMPNTGANYDGHSISGCCYLAATHYVEAYRYSSVSTTTRTSNPYGGWFSGFLIG